MENNINKQLEIVKNSIKWVKETESMRGAKGDQVYRQLVDFRRKLNKKKYAMEGNPAAAMYGESQVGKSYLISSLLSEEGIPFAITDENNIVHNFIEEINPPGGGSESTSLVSRFSVNYVPSNKRFPVKAVLLSPADIALVLSDSFYSDLKANHDLLLKSEEINKGVQDWKVRVNGRNFSQDFLSEDDILDMKDYFESNLTKASEVLSSDFFIEVSLIISKVKPEEWKDVFALLWNRNEKFTSLFERLMSEYQKLNFSSNVYLPLDSVLYKHGTLLDVKRLKEIYFEPDKIETHYRPDTQVLVVSNGQEQEITMQKSYLCALAAELVFAQPQSLLVNKPFLKETDLLDFPGARSRLTLPENLIETEIIPELLLRGKVAYLFNKYSECEKINILLFCAKHEQAAQRAMPEMLNGWINKIVGSTPEARGNFVSRSKVPPLFIIGTFFNVNLQYNPQQDKPGDISSFNYRWNQRFVRTLSEQLLNTEIYTWFEKWTDMNPYFQNIFMLRDFEKSESISHIFKGYNQNKKELEEVVPEAYPDFKEKLRESFIEYDFVKRHFENPAESWDRAASINEDGTKLIISKLTIAAQNINTARIEKTKKEIAAVLQGIFDLLKEFYNSPDKTDSLLKAISTAGVIQANLDIAFGRDPYFFGKMMQKLMISNSAVYDLFIKNIHDIERHDVVDMDKYSAIRMNVPDLDPNDSFDTNLECLRKHYEKRTLEECRDFFENTLHIDLNELFYGNATRVKSFSQVLAEALEEYWFNEYLPEGSKKLAEVFSDAGLEDILDMLHRLYIKLGVTKKISEEIRTYVDGYRNIEDVYEMIADISTEMVNKFINTVGLEYYNDSHYEDLKKAKENIHGLILEHPELQYGKNNRNEVSDLITQMGNLPELLNRNPLPKEAKRLPNYRGYIMWYDLLKAGFVTASGVPDYDPIANEKLGKILDECKAIKF